MIIACAYLELIKWHSESSGIHIVTDLRADQEIQPLAVAKVFEFLAKREKVGAILLGKQAIDGDHCQTGPMCAALLGWPQCTFASALKDDPSSTESNQSWMVERETDSGTETIKVCLPAVLTADLRLNEPRYATLPNIMKVPSADFHCCETLVSCDLRCETAERAGCC